MSFILNPNERHREGIDRQSGWGGFALRGGDAALFRKNKGIVGARIIDLSILFINLGWGCTGHGIFLFFLFVLFF